MILHIEKLTPDVYSENSRDFLLISRVYDAMFNGVKYDEETIPQLLNTALIREEFLPLLQTKLGFYNEVPLTGDEIRYILRVFPYILKHKGSLQAIEEMVNMCLKLYHVNANVKILAGSEGAIINNIALDKHSILIGIDTVLRSTTILRELCRYVMPPGFSLYVYFYTDVPVSSGYEYEDNIELLFSSDNIASQLRTTTAQFRVNAQSSWLPLGQFWGTYAKFPELVNDDVHFRSTLDTIKQLLKDLDTSSFSHGDVIRTISLLKHTLKGSVTSINTRVDLNNYTQTYGAIGVGEYIVVDYDETNLNKKTLYKWTGSEYKQLTTEIRYWIWQTESILAPGNFYPSDVFSSTGEYWYELPTYSLLLFDNNDFIYISNTTVNSYYRNVPVTFNRPRVLYDFDTQGSTSCIIKPGVGTFEFVINEIELFTKIPITKTPGNYEIFVKLNPSNLRIIYIKTQGQQDSQASSVPDLIWNEQCVTNFGVSIGNYIEAITGTVTTEYRIRFTTHLVNEVTREGTWTAISDSNIKFSSGPLFTIKQENKLVGSVNSLTLNSLDYNTSEHYLGIFSSLQELGTRYPTPSNLDMAIVSKREYAYMNSGWRLLNYRGVFGKNPSGSWPIDITEFEDYDLFGIMAESNKVYFRYTQPVGTGTGWEQIRCRGSVSSSIIDNPYDNDFVNPISGTHLYYLNDLWNSLGTYHGVKTDFPTSPSIDDYVCIQGATYYIKINNSLVDVSDTVHILELHRYGTDGREIL